MFTITIENLFHFHEYFDDKMISMKNFPLDFEKVQIYSSDIKFSSDILWLLFLWFLLVSSLIYSSDIQFRYKVLLRYLVASLQKCGKTWKRKDRANILHHLESCHVASECLARSRSPCSKNAVGIAQMDCV